MNSFYHFKQALDSKQKNMAMLILRDKTESVARKIMEKAKIHVPDYKGRIFWKWVQEYIIRACAQHEDKNIVYSGHRENIHRQTTLCSTGTQPVGDRSCQSHSADRNDNRPYQYGAAQLAATGTVCPGQGGVSPVCPDMGHKCQPGPGETSVAGAPPVDMGRRDTTGIHPGISGAHTVVFAEHIVRVCRRHAAAGFKPQRRHTGDTVWSAVTGHHGLAIDPGELWHSGTGSVSLSGTDVLITPGNSVECRGYHGGDIPVYAQRNNSSSGCPDISTCFRYYSDNVPSGRNPARNRKTAARPYAAVYASTLLLPCIRRSSSGAWPFPLSQLRRRSMLTQQPRYFSQHSTEVFS